MIVLRSDTHTRLWNVGETSNVTGDVQRWGRTSLWREIITSVDRLLVVDGRRLNAVGADIAVFIYIYSGRLMRHDIRRPELLLSVESHTSDYYRRFVMSASFVREESSVTGMLRTTFLVTFNFDCFQ